MMGINKFVSVGLMTILGLFAFGDEVPSLYADHNDVSGDTRVMTNTESWVSGKFATKTELEQYKPGAYESVSQAAMTAVQPLAIEDMATKNWTTNILEGKSYDVSTESGRTILASDIVDKFGGTNTAKKEGRLTFTMANVPANTKMVLKGVTATGNFTVDWGDGTVEVITNDTTLAASARGFTSREHTYIEDGDYVFDFPEGDITDIQGSGDTSSGTGTGFLAGSDGTGYIVESDSSLYEKPISYGMLAFARNPIKSIKLGTNVTSIGISCFSQCPKLEYAFINVKGQMGWGAFQMCYALKTVVIGKYCETLPSRCFYSDTALESVTFESGSKITTIGTDAFLGCAKLESLELPDGLKSFSLGYANNIKGIKLPDTLEELSNFLPADRLEYKTYTLPSNLKVTVNAFHSWTNLEYITMPRTMKTLGAGTFAFCYNLTNVEFEAGTRLAAVEGGERTEYNDPAAFTDCFKLKSIRLPFGAAYQQYGYTMKSLDTQAFDGCSALEEVILDFTYSDSTYNSTIGPNVFVSCPKVKSVVLTSAYAPIGGGDSIFGTGLDSNFRITIPSLSKENYIGKDYWKNYASVISEEEFSGYKMAMKAPVGSVATYGSSTFTVAVGKTLCNSEVFTIDWGDGNIDEYDSGVSPSHKYYLPYTQSGDKSPTNFVVKFKGEIKSIAGCRDADGNPTHTYLADGANNNADRTISFVYIDADEQNFKIGDTCFKGSTLESFNVGKYVTSIGNKTFQSSKSLGVVNFNSRGVLEEIGDYSFNACAMTSVEIPKSLYDIGAYAFYACPLTSVTYAKNGNIESIGDYAFTGVKVGTYTDRACILPEIEIPNTVNKIGGGAFQDCWYAKSISLPQDGVLTEIGSNAFLRAIANTGSIDIPKSVKKIGNKAFYGNKSITGINLPLDGKLEYIGDGAFGWTTNHLPAVVIPKSVKYIGEEIVDWDSVTNFSFAEDSVCEHIGNLGYEVKAEPFALPPNLTYFGGYYSWKTNGYAYVPELPDTVEYVGMLGPNDSHSEKTFTLPTNNLKTLNRTFSSWKIEYINIPASVTSIDGTFNFCQNLTNVSFDADSHLKTVGSSAFESCYALTKISIPDGVESIGSKCFSSCDKLSTITIPSTVTSIGAYVFSGCSQLSTIDIPTGITVIPYQCFSYCSALTTFTVKEGVTVIDDGAFQNCTSLKTLDLPSTTAEVGYDLCDNNTAMTRINCRATTPPTCSFTPGTYIKLFGDLPTTCYIYVPSASLSAYKSATGWSQYSSKIVGTTF